MIAVPTKKGACLKGTPRSFWGALVKNQRLLTTALADVTAARVDYPAAAGIYHMETTAAIRNGAVAAMLLILCICFIDLGFIVGHGETSLIRLASLIAGEHGLFNLPGQNTGSQAQLYNID